MLSFRNIDRFYIDVAIDCPILEGRSTTLMCKEELEELLIEVEDSAYRLRSAIDNMRE